MAQTSLRSSLFPSAEVEGRPTASDMSRTVITPATSIIDKRLQNLTLCHVTVGSNNLTSSCNLSQACEAWLEFCICLLAPRGVTRSIVTDQIHDRLLNIYRCM
jgi:hypothetical protein